MNWQEELSRNARDPEEAERERKMEEERKLREHTNEMANDVWNKLKQEMLSCVQTGNYKREYNKGIVECSCSMPMYYMDDHVTIRGKNEKQQDYHNLQVDPEYAKEYAWLNEALNKIAQENNAQFAWYYKVDDSSFETEFPSRCEFIFPRWSRRGQLRLRAISYFPIDPKYPMDYMSQEHLQEQAREKRALLDKKIDFINSLCGCAKKDLNFVILLLLVLVPIDIIEIYLQVVRRDGDDLLFWTTVYILVLLVALGCYYKKYKKLTLERDAVKNELEQLLKEK